jgi:hypothetical protein
MDNVLVKNGIIRHDFITGRGIHGIMGRKFLEAGYIYAPYIPITIESTVYDPNDFQPSEGVMSRYARTVVNNRFYGHISVSDFDNLGDD